MIPDPLTGDRLLLALDDCINPKTGKKIYGCDKVFDHAAKQNQSKYPWAQNIVVIGLLKIVKGCSVTKYGNIQFLRDFHQDGQARLSSLYCRWYGFSRLMPLTYKVLTKRVLKI
jgi:hypothetical protein